MAMSYMIKNICLSSLSSLHMSNPAMLSIQKCIYVRLNEYVVAFQSK